MNWIGRKKNSDGLEYKDSNRKFAVTLAGFLQEDPTQVEIYYWRGTMPVPPIKKRTSSLISFFYHWFQFYVLSKSESVKFLLIESVNCHFNDSPVAKYISLLNQLIITNWISGKNIFTVKSVNFHWSNQWNLTDLQ